MRASEAAHIVSEVGGPKPAAEALGWALSTLYRVIQRKDEAADPEISKRHAAAFTRLAEERGIVGADEAPLLVLHDYGHGRIDWIVLRPTGREIVRVGLDPLDAVRRGLELAAAGLARLSLAERASLARSLVSPSLAQAAE